MISFFDSEINDLTEVEFILKKLKNIDELKVAFSNTNVISSTIQPNSKQVANNGKSDFLKKKYQMLNSVTIDLINNTSSSADRSKSKKK
jgi:hypothetical protein